MNMLLASLRCAAPITLLALSACSRHTPATHAERPALPTAKVSTQAIGKASHLAIEEAVGTVRPRLRASVEPKVSGRIEKLPVAAGQHVNAGDLLVELDAREIRARLDQANALRDQARNDLDRFAALLKQEAVTRAEFDAVQARHRVAEAAAVEAETMLAHSRVTAPFAGVITRKFADVGDLASPGRALVELEDPSHLRLEASIPEALIDRVHQGATLQVRIATLDRELQGTVGEIAPSADPGSRTFLAKIDLPPDAALRTGLFGRVSIPVGEFAALRVPTDAIVHRGQLEIAFVVQDNLARLRLVKTGKVLGPETEILSGIESNEVVVVRGAATLSDGQPVQAE